MPVTLHVVDAFTDRPFAGNPAAVCVVDEPVSEGWMRAVAGEMNLSETAFLHRRDGVYDLRWFTPTVEVELCGHATLAAAHLLFELGHASAGERLRFSTRSGELGASREDPMIELDLPADPAEPATLPDDAAAALGVSAVGVWRARTGYLVEVASEDEVRNLRPVMEPLARYPDGFVVTAAATEPAVDFVSRYFVPGAGIPEDPVTGAAHCALGPFWGARLGRDEVTGFQASTRGGTVHVRVRGERVGLLGAAVTVAKVELLV